MSVPHYCTLYKRKWDASKEGRRDSSVFLFQVQSDSVSSNWMWTTGLRTCSRLKRASTLFHDQDWHAKFSAKLCESATITSSITPGVTDWFGFGFGYWYLDKSKSELKMTKRWCLSCKLLMSVLLMEHSLLKRVGEVGRGESWNYTRHTCQPRVLNGLWPHAAAVFLLFSFLFFLFSISLISQLHYCKTFCWTPRTHIQKSKWAQFWKDP